MHNLFLDKDKIMQKSFLVSVLFALTLGLGGCANPHINNARDITLPPAVVSHKIPVIFEDVEYDIAIRDMIAIELDRFPQAHDHITKVIVKKDLGDGYNGFYYRNGKIVLLHQNIETMRAVLWHEIGHALQETMGEDEIWAWCEIAAVRLGDSKIEDWMRDKWSDLHAHTHFPSKYATKNLFEFISEHFEMFMVNPHRHKYYFPEEHALIIKLGWSPKK